MEMNFTNFLHNILTLEGDEAESCNKGNSVRGASHITNEGIPNQA